VSTQWFKSTFSGEAGTCVEVSHRHESVLIRDSKYTGPEQERPIISVPADRWAGVLDLALGSISGVVGDALTITVHRDGGATLSGDGVDLVYNADEWDAFTKGVADGQFDRP
jgi:hypothetical protein